MFIHDLLLNAFAPPQDHSLIIFSLIYLALIIIRHGIALIANFRFYWY